MTKVFTQDDLVRYLYGETSSTENQMIEALLKTDARFQQLYKEMSEVKNQLDKSSQNPSDKTIQNILEFSKAYHLHSHSV